jgi:hypothetical protein
MGCNGVDIPWAEWVKSLRLCCAGTPKMRDLLKDSKKSKSDTLALEISTRYESQRLVFKGFYENDHC